MKNQRSPEMLEAAEVIGRFSKILIRLLQHIENEHARIRDLAQNLLTNAEYAVEEYARVRVNLQEALKAWPDAEQSAEAKGH